jgi:hypothetical protein
VSGVWAFAALTRKEVNYTRFSLLLDYLEALIARDPGAIRGVGPSAATSMRPFSGQAACECRDVEYFGFGCLRAVLKCCWVVEN